MSADSSSLHLYPLLKGLSISGTRLCSVIIVKRDPLFQEIKSDPVSSSELRAGLGLFGLSFVLEIPEKEISDCKSVQLTSYNSISASQTEVVLV